MLRARTAALVLLAISAISACDRANPGVGAPVAQADPSTSGSPQPGSALFPPEKIDTLLLSQDEVNAIVGTNPGLHADGTQKQPTDYASSSDYPSPPIPECRNALMGIGDKSVFGTNWKEYRFVGYNGFGNVNVWQAVGVYADESEAKERFAALTISLKACQEKNPALEVGKISADSAQWDTGDANSDGCSDESTLINNVVAQVHVCHFQGRNSITSKAMADLVGKIRS